MKTKPKRNPIFALTIRKKLILSFILILLVPSVTIGLSSYLNAQDNIKEKIQISSRENVLVIDKFITSFIEPKKNAASYFGGLFDKTYFSEEKIPTTIAHLKEYQVLHPEAMVVYIGSEENGDFLSYPEQDLPDGYDPRKRPWYIGSKEQSGETFITEPYIDAFTGGVIVTIAHTLRDGSGVFAMDLSLEALNKLTDGIKIGKNGYPILISAEGNYLVHPEIAAGEKAEGSWVQSLLEKKDGQVTDSHNQIDFTTNEITGMKIAGVMDLNEVSQDTKPILMMTLLIVGLFIVIGAVLSYFVIRSITRPLNQLVAATGKVSKGDLTQTFDVKNNDEISHLGISFNKMVGALRELIRNVDAKSEMLAASSEQLLASTEQNNTATEQIVDAIQEVATGTERQSKMVEESHHIVTSMSGEMEKMLSHSQAVRDTSMDAVSIVNTGNQAIQLTSEQMTNIHKTISRLSGVIEDLRKRSIDINQIIDVISGIAGQTNLLALNAAIEAARAGENGKGFAVVADEVRKLAEQSSRSTETIRQLISSIQIDTNQAVESMEKGTAEIEKGMDLAQSAGEAFHEIKQFIDHVNTEIQTISVSIKETSAGTEQVVGVVHGIEEIAVKTTADSQNVSAATEEQLASMQEIAASASSLSYMAEELQELIGQFKI